MEYKAKWFNCCEINEEHKGVTITQVYTWICSSDNQIIIVSKDNNKWQFPGGHPLRDETIKETAVREALEETGLDLEEHKEEILFFGYYYYEGFEGNDLKERFLQIRTFIRLDKPAITLDLNPKERDDEERDTIKFARAVKLSEAFDYIPWLKTKEELVFLIENGWVVK